jgi:hypothetical protein
MDLLHSDIRPEKSETHPLIKVASGTDDFGGQLVLLGPDHRFRLADFSSAIRVYPGEVCLSPLMAAS